MSRLASETNVDVLRQATTILERENQKLVKQVLALTNQIAVLQGKDSATLQTRLQHLEQQLAQSNAREFGKSSEKRLEAPEVVERVPPKKKTGHGPKAQTNLPVIETVHTLDDADKVCTSCGGALKLMEGQFEEAEEIDVIERQFVIRKHKREKYRCSCGACVETALPPPKLIEGGRYSIDFALDVAIAKYLDHLPLERQARMMKRQGLDVDSQTLWDQIERLARLLEKIPARILSFVTQQPVLGADETRWRMMGKGDSKTWQVWTACADKAVYYQIEDNRSTDAAGKMFSDYGGHIVCDGYSAYSALQKQQAKRHMTTRFRLVQCWAHVRRKFFECQKFFPKECAHVLDLIGQLYALEKTVTTDVARLNMRRTQSKAIVEAIGSWAAEVNALGQSALGKAIAYMAGAWSGLIRFLDDPKLPLDNNATERALRGIVVGRKNHYGSRSRRGTEVAALFYTLMESAKLANVDPKAYLREATLAAIRGDVPALPHEFVAPVSSS